MLAIRQLTLNGGMQPSPAELPSWSGKGGRSSHSFVFAVKLVLTITQWGSGSLTETRNSSESAAGAFSRIGAPIMSSTDTIFITLEACIQ